MEINKTGKYLKYAIGEIILVVVGILIALQINNWNQNQKASIKEAINLSNLKSEMVTTLIELKYDYNRHLINYESTLDVYQYIQTKPMETDSMYIDFFNSVGINYFFPKTSTYETLKSGNLELIKSDSLRALITDVYELGYQRLLIKVDTRRSGGRILFPYYQKHFRTKMEFDGGLFSRENLLNQKGIPNDYEFVINDPEFETLIVEAVKGRFSIKNDYERSMNYVENCISQIDEYLKN